MTIAPAAHDGGINGFGVWHRSCRWTGVANSARRRLPVMPWKAWVAAVAIAGAAFAAGRADAAPNVAHLSWGGQLIPPTSPAAGIRSLKLTAPAQAVTAPTRAPAAITGPRLTTTPTTQV